MAKKKRRKKQRPVAYVHCNGGKNAHRHTEPDEHLSCKEVLEDYPDGISDCSYGCVGAGTCVEECPFDALHINDNGVAEADPDTCTGCTLCTRVCPQNLITMVPRDKMFISVGVRCRNEDKGGVARKKCEVSCIACKRCEKVCPTDAIKVEDNVAAIDQEICIRCGACIEACPQDCINDVEHFFI